MVNFKRRSVSAEEKSSCTHSYKIPRAGLAVNEVYIEKEREQDLKIGFSIDQKVIGLRMSQFLGAGDRLRASQYTDCL